MPDISNPFFSLILQGIEDEAQRKGYAVLVGDTQHDPKREARYVMMLLRQEADEMAMRVIEAAGRRGVRVPRDLSVIGFDDIRFARHMDPPLTTIAQPMREIGAATVRMLVDILAGRTIAPVSVTLPHTLVVRSSTARVRG